MSLSFVSKINNDTVQEQIDSYCSEIWNKKPESAIKLFFFIRDIDQGKNEKDAFKRIMKWLYSNEENTFYKNLSLIVGIPNSHTLNMVKSQSMLKKEHKKHEDILDFFIKNDLYIYTT